MKKQADSAAARKKCEIEIANWIEHKVKWRKLHSSEELNCEPNDKLGAHKHFWGVNVKVLLDHLIKESGDECKFGCLPE